MIFFDVIGGSKGPFRVITGWHQIHLPTVCSSMIAEVSASLKVTLNNFSCVKVLCLLSWKTFERRRWLSRLRFISSVIREALGILMRSRQMIAWYGCLHRIWIRVFSKPYAIIWRSQAAFSDRLSDAKHTSRCCEEII